MYPDNVGVKYQHLYYGFRALFREVSLQYHILDTEEYTCNTTAWIQSSIQAIPQLGKEYPGHTSAWERVSRPYVSLDTGVSMQFHSLDTEGYPGDATAWPHRSIQAIPQLGQEYPGNTSA
ncbi:hypothetical protein CHS0354_040022 [Potamilus streckersoni]|uniref:Uncharacterized protein n=1 Tax=Potamilus streckersoni TaxID=2493646 RepID=A0AAE0ST40_9BIVA|nr:hypothetical protein CHS0354_040022 [Potamilus streckersoni]